MSNTWGDFLGQGSWADVGVGYSVAPKDLPQETDIFYKGWQHGWRRDESPEEIPPDAGTTFQDLEVDATDSLIRAPGIKLDRDITPRVATWMFQQPSVSYSTELVIIDPPYVGYKSLGDFTFNNLGISGTGAAGWTAVTVAGDMLFSNGVDASYIRTPNSNTVTDVSADIVAQCFATAFGRTFAGAFTDPITGFQALAVSWNAANGSLSDWSGLGSGAEFLIANNELADRIMAMVPIGLQTLGILCRKSLWAGYQTGQSDRPADFQLRFVGLGCVARDTAAATPYGIAYLSDEGLCMFDLTASKVVSHAINAELLPLDYNQLTRYRGVYDSTNKRYILSTPSCQYVYQFPHEDSSNLTTGTIPARWFRRSFIADSVSVFTDQSGNVYWNTVQDSWAAQDLTWSEMQIGELDAPSGVYFGKGSLVGFQSYGTTTNFDAAMDPVWESKQELQNVTDLIETHWFEVQYRAYEDAAVVFTTTDTDGELTNTEAKTLPSTGGRTKKVLAGVSSMLGMGSQLRIQYDATTLVAIERIRRVVMPAGPSTTVSI